MLRRTTLLTLILAFFSVLMFGQDGVVKKAPIKLIEPQLDQSKVIIGNGQSTAAENYVAVDTMPNSFGPAISALNPLAYDPVSNTVAVVYRGRTTYSAGSGELWYSISTDAGVTWQRVGAVNSNQELTARYPSMAILNQTGVFDQTIALFSWPQLAGGAFGAVGYGADQPVGGGQTFAEIISAPPLYSSQVPCWTDNTNGWMFWASDNTDDASINIFRTQDFVTVETISDPNMASSVFADGGSITMGGVSHNGVSYYGVVGTLDDPDPNSPIVSGWYPAYSKSTDNGATWSEWNVADFRSLSQYDRLYDYVKGDAFVSYHGDINVDQDGYVHMLVTVTDTTASSNEGINALVEIFETSNGWNVKVIDDDITDSTFTKFDGAALGQMGPSGYLAFNHDRDVLFAQWVNGTAAAGDSLVDIFYSYRSLDGEWSTPINATETNGINENSTHLAPMIKDNGDATYTAFSFYNYEAGNTGHDIVNTNPSVIYIAPITFSPATDISDNSNLVNNFELAQNYPNPFNPTTNIKYSVAERSNVTLKVFDMLGREVATLLNSVKEAGSYEVNFDASDLASGLYVYSITAGNFTSSKKMMLMK